MPRPCNPRFVPSRSKLHVCAQPGSADDPRIPNYLLYQAELEIHRSGAKKAKAKEGWMNREGGGGGFLGNSGGAGPPVKHEEKEASRQEETSKREVESLSRDTKPQMRTDQEKMGNSSVLPPPLSREQKLVAAIGPPPVAQVAPIPRVLQVHHPTLEPIQHQQLTPIGIQRIDL